MNLCLQIDKLTQKLDLIWNDLSGCVTLFCWLAFIKQETLSFLNIYQSLDISEVIQENEEAQNVQVIAQNVQVTAQKPVPEQSEYSATRICDNDDQGEASLGAQ